MEGGGTLPEIRRYYGAWQTGRRKTWHSLALGSCGVHFVGLNTKQFNWSMDGENQADLTRENWRKLKPLVEEKVFG
jgi:hypothetical protein